MNAVLARPGGSLSFERVPDPDPKPGEVVVELRAAALNRRDLLVRKGIYPFPLPIVPGSDGAGVRRDTGEEVVILPALRWGEREDAPGPGFEILGGPTNGTYAELVAIPEENLYTEGDWAEAAKELAGGPVDLVIDSVGSTWPDSLRCIRPGGRVVVFGATGGTEATLQVRPFYLGWQSLLGTTMGSPRDFAGLLRLLEDASWRPVLDSVRPLAEAESALSRLESGQHFGKLVLGL
jgi:NADPH:quinone reductase-like Zn-dependent oxidoreductase